ncbi:MAG: hypothetical protein OHK0013_39370 [Sandaracinaceae bacterium]
MTMHSPEQLHSMFDAFGLGRDEERERFRATARGFAPVDTEDPREFELTLSASNEPRPSEGEGDADLEPTP